MPRYYCDYCDTYLTHDSPSVREQHNAGYKHKANVRTYYQQYEAQLNQSLIDQKVKEHLGQAAAFPSIGAPYGPRPHLPILPTPIMPIPGQVPANSRLVPGIRLPVLPRPISGTPGYVGVPAMPPVVTPPGAPSLPGQLSGPPRPVTVSVVTMVPGGTMAPGSGGPLSVFPPTMYQPSTATPTTVGSEGSNAPAQATDANH